MGAGTTLAIIGLSISILGFAIWYILQTRKNYQYSVGQRLIPFTAAVDPTTGQSSAFTDAEGNPQIICPSGTVVNIVGAFYDISDPYGECTSTPAPLIGSWCDPSVPSTQACQTDDDCGSGGIMKCGSSGFCQLAPFSGSCPEGYRSLTSGSNNYCVPDDLCGPGIPNPVCSASIGSNQCATRDATDSVGEKCNGRPECSDLSISDFGPSPCPSLAPTTCISGYQSDGSPIWTVQRGPDFRGYCGLPYLPGWAGGPPSGSTTTGPNTINPSTSLGYTLHGIYACVPPS